jgi:hypothetical protein
MVYGALPPEARRMQAALFNAGASNVGHRARNNNCAVSCIVAAARSADTWVVSEPHDMLQQCAVCGETCETTYGCSGWLVVQQAGLFLGCLQHHIRAGDTTSFANRCCGVLYLLLQARGLVRATVCWWRQMQLAWDSTSTYAGESRYSWHSSSTGKQLGERASVTL